MEITIIGVNKKTLKLSYFLNGNHVVNLLSPVSSTEIMNLSKELERTRISLNRNWEESIQNSSVIFLSDNTDYCSLEDVRDMFDSVNRISKYTTGVRPLLVINRKVPVGTIKSIKSYISKNKINLDVAYVPEIFTNKIVIGVNKEVHAETLKQLFGNLSTEIQSCSPEMNEYYQLAKDTLPLVQNSFLSEVLSGAEGLSLNSDKLQQLLGGNYYSMGLLGFVKESADSLAKTMNNSLSVNSSVLNNSIFQNRLSLINIVSKLKQEYASIYGLGVSIIIGKSKKYLPLIQELKKEGVELHLYFTNPVDEEMYSDLHTKIYKNISPLLKSNKEIVILDDITTSDWNLSNKNVYDPCSNLNKAQIKTLNNYYK